MPHLDIGQPGRAGAKFGQKQKALCSEIEFPIRHSIELDDSSKISWDNKEEKLYRQDAYTPPRSAVSSPEPRNNTSTLTKFRSAAPSPEIDSFSTNTREDWVRFYSSPAYWKQTPSRPGSPEPQIDLSNSRYREEHTISPLVSPTPSRASTASTEGDWNAFGPLYWDAPSSPLPSPAPKSPKGTTKLVEDDRTSPEQRSSVSTSPKRSREPTEEEQSPIPIKMVKKARFVNDVNMVSGSTSRARELAAYYATKARRPVTNKDHTPQIPIGIKPKIVETSNGEAPAESHKEEHKTVAVPQGQSALSQRPHSARSTRDNVPQNLVTMKSPDQTEILNVTAEKVYIVLEAKAHRLRTGIWDSVEKDIRGVFARPDDANTKVINMFRRALAQCSKGHGIILRKGDEKSPYASWNTSTNEDVGGCQIRVWVERWSVSAGNVTTGVDIDDQLVTSAFASLRLNGSMNVTNGGVDIGGRIVPERVDIDGLVVPSPVATMQTIAEKDVQNAMSEARDFWQETKARKKQG